MQMQQTFPYKLKRQFASLWIVESSLTNIHQPPSILLPLKVTNGMGNRFPLLCTRWKVLHINDNINEMSYDIKNLPHLKSKSLLLFFFFPVWLLCIKEENI